jgi:hypothetical protein
VREQFAQTIRRALRQFTRDQLNERLKTALGASSPVVGCLPEFGVLPAALCSIVQEALGSPSVKNILGGAALVRRCCGDDSRLLG